MAVVVSLGGRLISNFSKQNKGLVDLAPRQLFLILPHSTNQPTLCHCSTGTAFVLVYHGPLVLLFFYFRWTFQGTNWQINKWTELREEYLACCDSVETTVKPSFLWRINQIEINSLTAQFPLLSSSSERRRLLLSRIIPSNFISSPEADRDSPPRTWTLAPGMDRTKYPSWWCVSVNRWRAL